MRQLMDDAEISDIERTFRSSPGLTYKLLLLVNSVAFAGREKSRPYATPSACWDVPS